MKYIKTHRAKPYTLNEGIKKKVKEKFKRSQKGIQKLPRDKWKYDNLKPMECSKISSKREVYSNTLTFREKQIKTQMRYHITPSKYQQILDAGEGVEKRKIFYIICGFVTWCSHYGEQYRHSLKNLK